MSAKQPPAAFAQQVQLGDAVLKREAIHALAAHVRHNNFESVSTLQALVMDPSPTTCSMALSCLTEAAAAGELTPEAVLQDVLTRAPAVAPHNLPHVCHALVALVCLLPASAIGCSETHVHAHPLLNLLTARPAALDPCAHAAVLALQLPPGPRLDARLRRLWPFFTYCLTNAWLPPTSRAQLHRRLCRTALCWPQGSGQVRALAGMLGWVLPQQAAACPGPDPTDPPHPGVDPAGRAPAVVGSALIDEDVAADFVHVLVHADVGSVADEGAGCVGLEELCHCTLLHLLTLGGTYLDRQCDAAGLFRLALRLVQHMPQAFVGDAVSGAAGVLVGRMVNSRCRVCGAHALSRKCNALLRRCSCVTELLSAVTHAH